MRGMVVHTVPIKIIHVTTVPVTFGEMVLSWAGAALLEAEERFLRVKGYRSLPLFLALLTKNLDSQRR